MLSFLNDVMNVATRHDRWSNRMPPKGAAREDWRLRQAREDRERERYWLRHF